MPEWQDLAERRRLAEAAAYPAPWGSRPRRLLRRAVLRLVRPFTFWQVQLNRELVAAVERLETAVALSDERIRGGMVELARAAPAIEELRRQQAALGGRVDRALERMGAALDAHGAAPPMWGLTIEGFDESVGRVYGFRRPAQTAPPEDAYRRFEEVFRGPPEVVAARQRCYLDLIGDRAPVLDVGCGRGDFLDLLGEAGLERLGVEPDPAMAGHARAKGHEVAGADAVGYLEGLDEDWAGTVFSAQVVEHMPADQLLRFFSLAQRKLRPGGLFIAESPNPYSPYTWRHFWVDVTHRQPIFPEAALTLCWASGYHSAYVFHPAGTGDARRDRTEQPEYAVVAAKGG
jgi:SAM-dependent methyltransferase